MVKEKAGKYTGTTALTKLMVGVVNFDVHNGSDFRICFNSHMIEIHPHPWTYRPLWNLLLQVAIIQACPVSASVQSYRPLNRVSSKTGMPVKVMHAWSSKRLRIKSQKRTFKDRSHDMHYFLSCPASSSILHLYRAWLEKAVLRF